MTVIAHVHDLVKVSNHLHIDKVKGQFVKPASNLIGFCMVRYHLYGTKIRLSDLPIRTDVRFLILLIRNLTGLVTVQRRTC